MRQIQAQAAEKRLRENETRGIKNPEHVKKMQMQKKELEERQNEAARSGPNEQGLRWTVNN
jgi:small VCP/p97-interacting protein